jgi:hypothetical protein
MDEMKLLERITVNPAIFGGKPIVRGRRLAIEHVLGCWRQATQNKASWKVTHGLSRMIFGRAWCMHSVLQDMNASNPLCWNPRHEIALGAARWFYCPETGKSLPSRLKRISKRFGIGCHCNG